jgi:CHAT domain-containing protein
MESCALQVAALASKAGSESMNDYPIVLASSLLFENERGSQPSGYDQETSVMAYSPADRRLPFAALEAYAIAALYGRSAQVAEGLAATAERFLSALRKTKRLHLCCHGQFMYDSPLDSKLFFSDRALTVREIKLRLENSSCELIVLSACEAGNLDFSVQRASFPRQLAAVGCQNVVAADWQVDDVATAFLMFFFHSALRSTTNHIPEALAQAKVLLRDSAGRDLAALARKWLPHCGFSIEEEEYVTNSIEALSRKDQECPFEHPMYWGGFSVTRAAVRLRA